VLDYKVRVEGPRTADQHRSMVVHLEVSAAMVGECAGRRDLSLVGDPFDLSYNASGEWHASPRRGRAYRYCGRRSSVDRRRRRLSPAVWWGFDGSSMSIAESDCGPFQ
jgi:hypothetical protein